MSTQKWEATSAVNSVCVCMSVCVLVQVYNLLGMWRQEHQGYLQLHKKSDTSHSNTRNNLNLKKGLFRLSDEENY